MLTHRIAVMYLGQIVEMAKAMELCDKPLRANATSNSTTAALRATRHDARLGRQGLGARGLVLIDAEPVEKGGKKLTTHYPTR